jgi:simple sugar transport system ATP-binding protein
MSSAAPGIAGRPAVDPDRPAVEAIGVGKRYGSTVALDDVTITVTPAETRGLVGRNGAGKSTLVAVLTGLQPPDAGIIRFGGEPAPALSDRDGWRDRVACVFQKSTVIPTLTVAENLFLNRHSRRGGLIRWGELRRRAEQLLATWSVAVDVRRPAGDLTVEQRQLVEIARALSFGARLIILDEPTAQLDAAAIGRLFDRMRALRRQGVTFLFISHHLHEVYEICQTVTVFRDARHIATAAVSELSREELVASMTGEATRLVRPPATRPGAEPEAPVALRARHLTLGEAYQDVSVDVRAGEVVGLAGGGGSGKAEFAETVVGLRTPDAGVVEIAGARPRPGSVSATLRAGLAFVPQDRHREGLVPLLSVAENVTLTIPERLGRAGFIAPRRRNRVATRMIDDLAIRTAGPEQPVTDLSGGNQQKVVMARALASDPSVLVLIAPTAGVDVRSKETLLGVVDEMSRRGTAVLLVSDELDDLRRCDRVLVMFAGRIVRDAPRGWRDNDLVATMEGLGLDGARDDSA